MNEWKCGFAPAGTYGHDCGRPASIIAVMNSELTTDGAYYTGRCPACAQIKGGENKRVIRFEAIGNQSNKWK
jgi:hypothetical protein